LSFFNLTLSNGSVTVCAIGPFAEAQQ